MVFLDKGITAGMEARFHDFLILFFILRALLGFLLILLLSVLALLAFILL